jgi:glycosyltransferase involved in cell wall biosynthesis
MPEGPSFSIIMNCFNSSRYLREALESVLAQTMGNWEIVFWDNRSTDESAEIFKSFKDPRFKYYLAPEHTPLGPARHLAIQKAENDWISFLDCDDIWEPRKLELQAAAVAAPSKPVFIFGDMLKIDADGRELSSKGVIASEGGKIPPSLFKFFMTRGNLIGLSAVAFDKKVYGGDVMFKNYMIAEEIEVWLNIAWRWPENFVYVPEPLYKYRVHSGCLTRRHQEKGNNEYLSILEYWLGKVSGAEMKKLCAKRLAVQRVCNAIRLARAGSLTGCAANLIMGLKLDKACVWNVIHSAAAKRIPF